jgi:aminopeptidase 2
VQSANITDKDIGRVSLTFPIALPAGTKAQLKIHYNAMLRGNQNGYYKSAWQKDGVREYYALTYFEVPPLPVQLTFHGVRSPSMREQHSLASTSQP